MINIIYLSNNYTIIIRDRFNDHMLAHSYTRQFDRFIPQRSQNNSYHPDSCLTLNGSTPDSFYSHHVKKQLFEHMPKKVVNFSETVTEEQEFYSEASSAYFKQINPNVQSPVKVLYLDNYRDDFYLNNVDWSDRGPVVMATENQIFLYTAQTYLEICEGSLGSYISGIKSQDCIVAAGKSNGVIEIYDLVKKTMVRAFKDHENRVSALAFVDGLMVSGSKDRSILVHDLRQWNNVVKKFNEHNGEICSLKLKQKGERIFASGSSDGSAIVWDIHYGKIDRFKGHKGAVKALDWCPWKNGLLATGGGNSTEKSIKIWSTSQSKCIASQPIEDQISGLLWNEELKMLTTSHGYQKNQIAFWTLDSNHSTRLKLEKQKSFQAHKKRVLNMVQSPDSNYLCTVGADQNLKFWCLKESDKNPFKQVDQKKEYLRL